MNNAYAPYSGYKVGAGVRDERGLHFSGCNVENISYGATMCAERNAVGEMVAQGGKKISRMAVMTVDGGLPCGMCLQVMREFGSDFEIEIFAESELVRVVRLSELLPLGFDSKHVNRT